jgi:PAS domain S-box-containing protein
MDDQNRYSSIVENVPDGIYILSQDRFEYVNPAFERITGIRREDLEELGLGFLEMIHPDDRWILWERRKARMEGKSIPPVYQLRIFQKDGTLVRIELNNVPLSGRTGSVLGVVRDITGRKQPGKTLPGNEFEFRALLDRANNGILILQDGIIRYANPYMETLCGHPNEETIGSPFRALIFGDDLDATTGFFRGEAPGDAMIASREAVLRHKLGHRVPIDLSADTISFLGKKALLVIIHDITRHKDTESQLKITLERLRNAMSGTIRTIGKIVESKDPYTASHQRRVADLGRAIAASLGLPASQIDAIYMAGQLHDLGKIGVPAELLTKPTAITETEFQLIKAHSEVAHDILKTIDFPWPIARIILQHHERLDGSGYPGGLKAGEILAEAKILAVADVVEAMISDRPYRPARSLDEALAEISSNREILYDGRAADACIDLFRKKGYKIALAEPEFHGE